MNRKRFYCTATIVQWNYAAQDYDEIELEHYAREPDEQAAEYAAREEWTDHGYNPDSVIVRPY